MLKKVQILGATLCVSAMVATPVLAERTLKMATSWGGGPLLEYGAMGFAATIEELSNGEIKVEVFPGGTLGSPLKISEAVKNGVADMGHTSPTYEWGANPANIWLGGFAGSLGSEAMVHWLYQGGGLEMFQKFRREAAGVVDFPCGMTPEEAGLHSTRPIQTLDDFKGMRFRAAGAFAKIAAELGASPVTISKDEVIPAMERGALDSADFSTLSLNRSAEIHKVAKYLIVPGFHQPVNVLNCPINVEVWESFTEREQDLIRLASEIVTNRMGQQILVEDADALDFYLSEGVEIVRLDDAFLDAIDEATATWVNATAAELGEDHWFTKLRDHQNDFAAEWDQYTPWRR